MCIVFLDFKNVPHLPLILAANRDEFFERPALPMHFWEDYPSLLAGKDLMGGGTWLGMTRKGRLAVITNYRELTPNAHASSRGGLVTDFLLGRGSIADFQKRLEEEGRSFNGFNLLFGTVNELHYYSNQIGHSTTLEPGVYGLSNHLLDTPWPKVELGKGLLHELPHQDTWGKDALFGLLTNTSIPPDHLLPQTGVELAYERTLGSIFVTGTKYGTRCSTVIKMDDNLDVSVQERTYTNGPDQFESRSFRFFLDSDLG